MFLYRTVRVQMEAYSNVMVFRTEIYYGILQCDIMEQPQALSLFTADERSFAVPYTILETVQVTADIHIIRGVVHLPDIHVFVLTPYYNCRNFGRFILY